MMDCLAQWLSNPLTNDDGSRLSFLLSSFFFPTDICLTGDDSQVSTSQKLQNYLHYLGSNLYTITMQFVA